MNRECTDGLEDHGAISQGRTRERWAAIARRLPLYHVRKLPRAARFLERLLSFGRSSTLDLGARTIHFTQASSLALEPTEIKKLGAADLVGANDLNLVQHRGIQREDTFDALAEADLTHGEAALWTVALGNERAFKGLSALFVAFLDLDLDADGIPGIHWGKIFALQPGSKLFHDWVLGHRF